MLNLLKRRQIVRIAVFTILLTMIAWLMPTNVYNISAATGLQNPRITEYGANGSITWDCIEFGSYPQSSVKTSEEVYKELEGNSNWDNNGETILDGIKYRKEQRQYEDSETKTYYYKYEPIKWRVLSVNEGKALLLAEKALDFKKYNEKLIATTWETSTIRSWLNGYGTESNQCGLDYESENFMNTAFNEKEQGFIKSNTETNDMIGVNDKIFLLSLENIKDSNFGLLYTALGYYHGSDISKPSSYANKPSSADWNSWWSRSSDSNAQKANVVFTDSDVDFYSVDVNRERSVIPALFLDLTSDCWTQVAPVTVEDEYHIFPISITASKSKTVYKINEPLSLDDLTVTAIYTNHTTKTVTGYQTNATDIDMKTAGEKTLVITYTDRGIKQKDFILITVTDPNAEKKPDTNTDQGTNTNSGNNTGNNTNQNITANNNARNVSSTTTVTKPAKVTIKKVTSPKKKTLKVAWKRDSKATGYQAMIAIDKKFKKNKKTATISKNKTVSKTFTKLKSKKVYYAKVRAYKKSGSKKIYGAYSKVKKVKIK